MDALGESLLERGDASPEIEGPNEGANSQHSQPCKTAQNGIFSTCAGPEGRDR